MPAPPITTMLLAPSCRGLPAAYWLSPFVAPRRPSESGPFCSLSRVKRPSCSHFADMAASIFSLAIGRRDRYLSSDRLCIAAFIYLDVRLSSSSAQIRIVPRWTEYDAANGST